MDLLTARPRPRPGPFRGGIRASLCSFFPASHGLPGLAEVGVDPCLDRLYADSTATIGWALVAAALGFQLAPILTVGRPLPAAWLRPSTRDRHAERCSKSTIYVLRQAAFLLKTFGGMCWAADADVRRRLGQAPLGTDPDTWRAS